MGGYLIPDRRESPSRECYGLLGLAESASCLFSGSKGQGGCPSLHSTEVQIATLGQSGGGQWHSNSSPAVAHR
ncbi:hypothetical protein AOLI_G00022170 [Acnodon oligacanthus]